MSLTPHTLKTVRNLMLNICYEQGPLFSFVIPILNNEITVKNPCLQTAVKAVKRMVTLLVDISVICGIDLCCALNDFLTKNLKQNSSPWVNSTDVSSTISVIYPVPTPPTRLHTYVLLTAVVSIYA